MRALVSVVVTAACAAGALAAQDSSATGEPGPLCYRPAPKPACSAFILTNFGGYVVLGLTEPGETPFRGVADWGFMVNVSARDAIGASVFASLDGDGFRVGPAARYRRWLPPAGAIEVAVGAPLAVAEDIERGSVFGLVKWSPNHWFAVAARPEVVRRAVFLGCGPTSCDYDVQSRGRVSLGVEFGWVPGLVLTGAAAGAGLVLLISFAGAYN